MGIVLAFILILGLITLANYLVVISNERYNRLFDWLLLLLNGPLLFMGLVLMVLPADLVTFLQQRGLPLANLDLVGAVMIFIALWGSLASLRPVRRFLARRLPLNPESPVHALALWLSGYLVGNTLLTLTQGGLVELAANAFSVTIGDVIVQQLLFILLALFGVGLAIRRYTAALRDRLGLGSMTWAEARMGLRWIIFLVLLQAGAGALWAGLDPTESELLDEISRSLFGGFDTVGEWIVLALASGVGEELLFRGALQPVFGLWFTSILFAVAHVQYGLTPITLVVFILGIALGYIRRRSNTTVAIFVHAGYNFVLGLLTLIATSFVPEELSALAITAITRFVAHLF